MNMKAFSRQTRKHTLREDKKVMQVELQPPSSKAAYKLALIIYNHALRYKISDNLEWRYEKKINLIRYPGILTLVDW